MGDLFLSLLFSKLNFHLTGAHFNQEERRSKLSGDYVDACAWVSVWLCLRMRTRTLLLVLNKSRNTGSWKKMGWPLTRHLSFNYSPWSSSSYWPVHKCFPVAPHSPLTNGITIFYVGKTGAIIYWLHLNLGAAPWCVTLLLWVPRRNGLGVVFMDGFLGDLVIF